jgi:hypothetical protein
MAYLSDFRSDITGVLGTVTTDLSNVLNAGQTILTDIKGAEAGAAAANFAQTSGMMSATLPWLIVGALLIYSFARKR